MQISKDHYFRNLALPLSSGKTQKEKHSQVDSLNKLISALSVLTNVTTVRQALQGRLLCQSKKQSFVLVRAWINSKK
jgi:hypothetical protein